MSNDHVVIYTKDDCSFCTGAKALLTARAIPFVEMSAAQEPARLLELNITSLPAIVASGDLVGGFDSLRALDRSGSLHARLGVSPD